MSDYVVLRGRTRRVQLGWIDLTGEDVPPAIRRARPLFYVRSLPSNTSVYTAYWLGEQHYCGDDPDLAYDVANRLVPGSVTRLPHRVRDYLLRWSRGMPEDAAGV